MPCQRRADRVTDAGDDFAKHETKAAPDEVCVILLDAFETEISRRLSQPLCLGGVRASGQSPDSDDFYLPHKTPIVVQINLPWVHFTPAGGWPGLSRGG
jgi:hypothetical protein